jgi:hypothetical protein
VAAGTQPSTRAGSPGGTTEGAAPAHSRRIGLSGVVLALVLVGLLLGSTLFAVHQYDKGKRVAVNDIRARTVLAATIFDSYFTGDIATLGAVAASKPLRTGNAREAAAYLDRVAPRGTKAFTGGILWIGANGAVRASTATMRRRSGSLADRSYVRHVLRTKKPYVSEGLRSRLDRKRIIVVAVPTLAASGAVNGVLAGVIVVQPGGTGKSAIDLGYSGLVILDRSGQSLLAGFSKPRNAALARRIERTPSGTLTDTRGLDGSGGRVVVWASSALAGWTIAIDRSRSSAFASARRALFFDLALLAGLVLAVAVLIGWLLRRGSRAFRQQREALDRERETALTLQRSMLPRALASLAAVEVGTRYRSGASGIEVGGDWFDVVGVGETTLRASVGDVAGRGIEAATLMGQLRSTFRAYAWLFSSPGEIVESMQRAMPADAMATTVCLTVDTATWELSYASAGHLPVMVLDRATDVVTMLDANGPPLLGLHPALTYADVHVTLSPGTTLVAYTDGLVERRTKSIDAGIERLAEALRAGASLDADALAGRLLAELDEVPGAEDDVALLVLKCVDVTVPA